MSAPHKVYAATKLKPGARERLVRLAARRQETLSAYVANVLEAHADGLVFCTRCGHAHPIYAHELIRDGKPRSTFKVAHDSS